VATFRTLRELLVCKEIWVAGAGRYRNPDDDLPKDFEARRVDHYAELRKPLDPQRFVAELRAEMEIICRYLCDRDLQRQIEEGLNVVEGWNRANAVIAYGKTGEISTNRKEEVEMTVACLRILQAGLRTGVGRAVGAGRPARLDRAVLGAHPSVRGHQP
jgi:hypothetical protein